LRAGARRAATGPRTPRPRRCRGCRRAAPIAVVSSSRGSAPRLKSPSPNHPSERKRAGCSPPRPLRRLESSAIMGTSPVAGSVQCGNGIGPTVRPAAGSVGASPEVAVPARGQVPDAATVPGQSPGSVGRERETGRGLDVFGGAGRVDGGAAPPDASGRGRLRRQPGPLPHRGSARPRRAAARDARHRSQARDPPEMSLHQARRVDPADDGLAENAFSPQIESSSCSLCFSMSSISATTSWVCFSRSSRPGRDHPC